LQLQDTKLHARGGCCPAAMTGFQTACARGCPAAVSGSQTSSLSNGRANMQQQQQSKMYTRGALQALAGKNGNCIKLLNFSGKMFVVIMLLVEWLYTSIHFWIQS
jgi:hypothetical protein